MADEVKAQDTGTISGGVSNISRPGVTEYSGANTRDHNLEIVNQYRDTVDEYNATSDSAVKDGVKELQALEAASNNAYAQAEQAAARDYKELLETRSGVEKNNGNRQRIGESQFGQPEAAYGNALDSVRAAQAQMTRDVARQVSDLRAQGEYQKANAALQAAQNYLTNQYAEALRRDTNLRSNYEYQTSIQREDAAIEREQSATDKAWLREMGMTLLQQGIMPDSTMLEAMGISSATAKSVVNRAKMSRYSGGGGGSGSKRTGKSKQPDTTNGRNQTAIDNITNLARQGQTTAAYTAIQQSNLSQSDRDYTTQYTAAWNIAYKNPAAYVNAKNPIVAQAARDIMSSDWYSRYY